MIVFFPELYEDELAYSWFSRYHVHSGHMSYSATARDLYGEAQAIPSAELLGTFSAEIQRIIERYMPLSIFVEKHTMFPQYARFLPIDRRRTALEYILTRDLRYNDALYKRKGKPQMRYCPLCAAADRQRHGETYWHRKAQLAGINICLEHRCRLEDSAIGLAVDGLRFKLIHAELVIPQDTAADFDVSDLEYRAAEYVMQVFEAPMDYDNDVLIGRFLRSRLEGTKYTSLRGEQVFARMLHGDAIYMSIKNGYEHLFSTILSYSEKNCLPLFGRDEDGSVDFLVVINDSLTYMRDILTDLGYKRQIEADYDNYVYPLEINVTVDLPEGFKLLYGAEYQDEENKWSACNLGFHPDLESPDYRNGMNPYISRKNSSMYQDSFECIVVDENSCERNDVCSYCFVYVDKESKTAYIEPVSTREKYRHKGIGTAMMHGVMRRCKEKGIEKCYVNSYDWRRQFYNAAGFITEDSIGFWHKTIK